MTVGEFRGRKVQEVKKLIQKLLIDRVMLPVMFSNWLVEFECAVLH